ncbi:hypothetical protein BSG1_13981 [Bacillus sp. SG-1]|nr:hypothetical protein BSG1_13981 [Bacillus sp. SG-1]
MQEHLKPQAKAWGDKLKLVILELPRNVVVDRMGKVVDRTLRLVDRLQNPLIASANSSVE